MIAIRYSSHCCPSYNSGDCSYRGARFTINKKSLLTGSSALIIIDPRNHGGTHNTLPHHQLISALLQVNIFSLLSFILPHYGDCIVKRLVFGNITFSASYDTFNNLSFRQFSSLYLVFFGMFLSLCMTFGLCKY